MQPGSSCSLFMSMETRNGENIAQASLSPNLHTKFSHSVPLVFDRHVPVSPTNRARHKMRAVLKSNAEETK